MIAALLGLHERERLLALAVAEKLEQVDRGAFRFAFSQWIEQHDPAVARIDARRIFQAQQNSRAPDRKCHDRKHECARGNNEDPHSVSVAKADALIVSSVVTS